MFDSTIPIYHAILSHLRHSKAAYHVPGHKMGRGLPGEFGSWLGAAGRLDLTEIPGLDDLHAPEEAIAAAVKLAADAFGAEETFFLVNGSTVGNLAMILTAVRPGETVLVPRNLHKSVLNGLILAQARPVFYQPDLDERFGIASGVAVETIRQAVLAHPEAKAVLLTSPTYHGICSDLKAISEVVHAAGMLVLVDEAHGAHFAFHEELPQAAMASGADMAVQSTHKMLGSLTQTAMLHIQGPRVDRVRLKKRLQLVQSTSPSYLFLASLDCARHQMQTEGRELLEKALQAVRAGADEVARMPHLALLTESGSYRVDPFKWTIQVTGLGRTGADVYDELHEKGLTLELSDPGNVVAVFSYADRARQVERLLEGLRALEPSGPPICQTIARTKAAPTAILLPHDAFEREAEAVPLDACAGRVAAEMVIPYPPGIPLIMPGEAWTQDLAEDVQKLREARVRFQGVEDGSLSTVLVLKETMV